MNPTWTLGIDPQPSAIAGCCVGDRNGRVVYLHMVRLAHKAQMSAQRWQEYVITEFEKFFDNVMAAAASSGATLAKVAVEQQRGRVNSMMEVSCVAICMQKRLWRLVVSPKTWKSWTDVPCTGDHNENKKESTRIALPFLISYDPGVEKRHSPVHHLCDAYHIATCVGRMPKQRD